MSGGIFGQSLTRVRAGTRTTRSGDTVTDWSPEAVEESLVDRVSVQPNFQREDVDEQGDTRITGYRVLSQPGTTPDITALDRLRFRGLTYVVRGEVAYWPDPHGRDHIEFVMVNYEGA